MITRIDIFQLWQLTVATLNISQGSFLRPQRTFVQWVNAISKELVMEKVAEWEKSQVLDDTLALSFLRSVNIKLVTVPGQNYDTFVYPQEYAYFSTARFLLTPEGKAVPKPGAAECDCRTGECTPFKDEDDLALEKLEAGTGPTFQERNLNKVDNQRWGSVMGHKIKPPSVKRPYITQFDGGFKVAPAGMGVIVLDFLKRPRDAVFAYTLGTDDSIIYDAAGSVQLEWTDMVMGEFITRIKKRYASFIEDGNLYAQATKE